MGQSRADALLRTEEGASCTEHETPFLKSEAPSDAIAFTSRTSMHAIASGETHRHDVSHRRCAQTPATLTILAHISHYVQIYR